MKNLRFPAAVAFAGLLAFHVSAAVHYVDPGSLNPTPPYTNSITAATNIQDAIDVADAGDLVLVTNGNYTAGGRRLPLVSSGTFNRVAVTNALRVESVNGPAVTIIQGVVPGGTNIGIRCVYLANGATLAGFTVTNGNVTQSILPPGPLPDSAGGIYCESTSAVVSNCVIIGNAGYYAGGVYSGTLNACLIISNSVTGSSGISTGGGGANQSVLNDCILSGNTASGYGGGAYQSTLKNCAVSNNSAGAGGGVYYGYLTNCTLSGNRATAPFGAGAGGGGYGSGVLTVCSLVNCTLSNNFADRGAGASGCFLQNCLVTGNRAATQGGGTSDCYLTNCTIVANTATNWGGGSYSDESVKNCIVYFNTAPSLPNCSSSGVFYTCTLPMPSQLGGNNITNAPLFVDQAGGDFHLQSASPCINAGCNGFVTSATDLDGNPRIAGGTVDVGAYEFQSPTSLLSYAWLQQYGLPTDGSVDFADSDADGLNNWQEWRAATDPTNALSVLKMFAPSNSTAGVTLSWQSAPGRTYFLERSTNLLAQPAFQILATNIAAASSTTSFTDTNAIGSVSSFYRVGVQY